MEKFINNLYSNSHFPIVLACLIVVFVVLFVITLFLALKDAKNNSLDEDEKKEESKDKVEFKEPIPEVKEEPQTFEEVSFDSEEAKEEKANKYSGVSFEEPKVNEAVNETSPVDVIEETTTSIPVLKDEEISNFEEFFLQNLKDKNGDNNIFDFSKKDDNNISDSHEDETSAVQAVPAVSESGNAVSMDYENANVNDVVSFAKNDNLNSEKIEEKPAGVELPKMKKEYTFKELDGESYRLK